MKRDLSLLIAFLSLSISFSFISDLRVLVGLYFLSLFIIILRKEGVEYFKFFLPLYLLCIFTALLNGTIWGVVASLRVILVSNTAFVYKTFTSYYRIANIFYSSKVCKRGFRCVSVLLILVFIFLSQIKRRKEEYDMAFYIRTGSRSRHIVKYISQLAVNLLQSMLEFADDVTLCLENRKIL